MPWRAIYPRFEDGRQRAGNLTSNGSRPPFLPGRPLGCFPSTARLFPKPGMLPHLRARSWHESDLPTDVFEVRLLGRTGHSAPVSFAYDPKRTSGRAELIHQRNTHLFLPG
jgi:hypothetical protein